MIKIVLCEDHIEQQKCIQKYLEKILIPKNLHYNLDIYSSGEDLLENYPQNTDIFILDIKMSGINGMDVAKKIREIDKNMPEIIFTTSLIEYMQEGYEVRAYRYLLKPIDIEELKKHILFCIGEIIHRMDAFLLVENKDETFKIKAGDITYIEIQKKDMKIHTEDKIYNTKMTMNKVEKELMEYNFFRCHKSFLVNVEYVQNIKRCVAILENNIEIPVSRHRFKGFKKVFLSSLGEKLC